MIGQDTVFAHDRYNIRCNAYSGQVEQRNQMMKLDAVTDGKSLHEFEPHATSRKMGVWVCIIQSFGIQDGNGRGQYVVRYMMVADDKVNSLLFGIRNLFYGFNAAVQYDDKPYSGFSGVVNSFFGNSVSFVITVRDVIVKVRIELLNELVDQCHSRGTVHIVISINQNALFLSHRHVQAFHCDVHILH